MSRSTSPLPRAVNPALPLSASGATSPTPQATPAEHLATRPDVPTGGPVPSNPNPNAGSFMRGKLLAEARLKTAPKTASFNPEEQQQQLRLANIKDSIAPTLVEYKRVDKGNYEFDTDKPFSFSINFVIGVCNLQSLGLPEGRRSIKNPSIADAINCFEQTISGIDILSDISPEDKAFIQLESWHYLIRIREVEKSEKPERQEAFMKSILDAHDFVSRLPSLSRDGDSCYPIARIYGKIMEQWDHFSSEEQAVFLPHILEQVKENGLFFSMAEAAFHRAIFEPLVLQGTDPDIKSLITQALKDTKHSNNFSRRIFLENLEVTEWKNTHARDKLINILDSIKTREQYYDKQATLTYFDLFVHAQDPAEKREIAKAFAERVQEKALAGNNIAHQLYLENKTQSTQAHLSSFAFASMQSYYFSSREREPGSLGKLTQTYVPIRLMVPIRLKEISELLSSCINNAPMKPFNDEGRLAMDIALESISLKARITSRETTEALKNGEDMRTRQAIDEWSYYGRREISEKWEKRPEIAQHSRTELARTE